MAKTETKEKELNGGENLPAVQTQSFATHVALGSQGVVIQTLDDLYRFGGWIVSAGLAPAGVNAQAVCLMLQAGMEIGLTPMQSLNSIYVVNNRTALYGEVGIALARKTGQMQQFDQYFEGDYPNDDFTAVCEIRRTGMQQSLRREFSIGDAKLAKIWGANVWAKYPKDMMMWKATWRALKSTFADVLKGLSGYEDIIDVSYENVPPAPDPPAKKRKSSRPQIITAEVEETPSPAAEKPAKKRTPAPDPESFKAVEVEVLEREAGDETEAINPLDLPPEPEPEAILKTKDGFCQCGEKMDSNVIEFWRNKPAHLERLCYTCAVLKKNGKPYGQERES